MKWHERMKVKSDVLLFVMTNNSHCARNRSSKPFMFSRFSPVANDMNIQSPMIVVE